MSETKVKDEVATILPSQVPEGIVQLVRHSGYLYPMYQKYKPEYKVGALFTVLHAIKATDDEKGKLVDVFEVREFSDTQIVVVTKGKMKVGFRFMYYETMYEVTKVVAERNAGPEISIVHTDEIKTGIQFLFQTQIIEITSVFDSRKARGEHKVKTVFYDCGYKVVAEIKKPEPPKEKTTTVKQSTPA